jgi:hypothetical protein
MNPVLDSRAALRAAVRRITALVQRPEVEVTVRRADLELLLACAASKILATAPPAPKMHPEQR